MLRGKKALKACSSLLKPFISCRSFLLWHQPTLQCCHKAVIGCNSIWDGHHGFFPFSEVNLFLMHPKQTQITKTLRSQIPPSSLALSQLLTAHFKPLTQCIFPVEWITKFVSVHRNKFINDFLLLFFHSSCPTRACFTTWYPSDNGMSLRWRPGSGSHPNAKRAWGVRLGTANCLSKIHLTKLEFQKYTLINKTIAQKQCQGSLDSHLTSEWFYTPKKY